MKISYQLLILFLISLILFSCGESEDEELLGNWSKLSPLDGIPRSEAVGFVLNGKGYIGTGYNGIKSIRLNDFWQYDAELNYWTQKADFPGVARTGAVGFGIENKGYIGTGYDGEDELNDFWEYDPTTNTWKAVADFIGSARYGAVSFAINDKGYVGSGYDDNYQKDFYAYSPSSDSWSAIISIGGDKRIDASAFVINGFGYVISGLDNGTYQNDMWKYDPSTGYWTEMNFITDYTDDSFDDDYSSIARTNGVAFVINDKGYLATGSAGTLLSSVWEYDPVDDLWTERTSFEGNTRTEAVGFSIGNLGYVTTGRSSSYYLDDIWSFDPTAEYDENY